MAYKYLHHNTYKNNQLTLFLNTQIVGSLQQRILRLAEIWVSFRLIQGLKNYKMKYRRVHTEYRREIM